MKKPILLSLLIFILSACSIDNSSSIISIFSNDSKNSNTLTSLSESSINKSTSLSSLMDLDIDLKHNLPKSDELKHLDKNVTNRIAGKTLEILDSTFTSKEEDYVISPSSFILAVGGLFSVSDNVNNEAFGFNNPIMDTKALLEAWNYSYEYKASEDEICSYSFFKSCILHQQIGDIYKFDESKREIVANNYISTLVSSPKTFRNDAQYFFEKEIGLNLSIPEFSISDGVVTYGAIKMKDYVPGGLGTYPKPFNFKDKVKDVDSCLWGSELFPKEKYVFENDKYYVFSFEIKFTSLLIVLPKVGVDINSISVSEAYNNYLSSAAIRRTYGYIPYFHNKSENVNLSLSLKSKLNGNEVFWSKLLKDDVINDLSITGVYQSSDFEFNKYGVEGESITAIFGEGSSMPKPGEAIDLSCDRPFYAISIKDNFPLFINKISNPGENK